MRLNIQTKLFLLMAGLAVAVLAAVLWWISRDLEAAILEKVVYDFNQTRKTFRKEQVLRYDRLLESSLLIGENPAFKGNVQVEDPASVQYIVEEVFALYAKFDLFVVVDRRGEILARFRAPEGFPADFQARQRPGMQRALQGHYPDLEIDKPDFWPEFWEVDGELFQVAVVPVYLGDAVIGAIAEGARVAQFEAEQLKGDSAIDITFLFEDRLVASTIDSLDGAALARFVQAHRDTLAMVRAQMRPSATFEGHLAGEQVFAFVSPLGQGGETLYIASVPRRYELDILEMLQSNILFTAAISLGAVVLLSLALGRTATRPILRLVDGMNRVKGGDLDVELEASTSDEIGLLTSTFNEMIGGLRERLHLMRYVGAHTIDMIRKASGVEVKLGGSSEELAVLFSDIRGFSAYSEKRQPQEVIAMLNRYLGFQAQIVPEFGGSIDKFVGDEMVAIFIGEEAVERAVGCALEIQRCVRREHQTDPVPIHVGIGINYGPAILGNMGAENRLDYTVIGAAVNLGARLMQVAGPGEILMRRELLDGLQVRARVVEVRTLSFKGFSEAMEVVSIAGEEEHP